MLDSCTPSFRIEWFGMVAPNVDSYQALVMLTLAPSRALRVVLIQSVFFKPEVGS